MAEEGYQVAVQGDAAINAALSRMVERRPSKRGCMGQYKAYGYLYAYLYRFKSDPSFKKLCAIVSEHAFATLPFEPGRTVLGATLENRRVYNHSSAAQTFSRSGVGLRRLLEGSGVIVPERTNRLKIRVSIPTKDMEAIAEKLGDYLTTKDVVAATGFDRKLVDHLASNGLLRTLPKNARPAGGYHRYHRNDVDALMSSLFRRTETVDALTERRVSVAKARNKTRGYAADILAMILDGSLQWVGRLGEGSRYEHLLVDIDEVVGIIRTRSTKKGIYAKEAEAIILGVYASNISRLAKAGFLMSTTEFCPKSMRTMDVLTRESAEAFAAKYVSVAEISHDTGIHVRNVATRLLEAGIVEAIDREVPKTRIYRRRDVAASCVFQGWPTGKAQ
jgi:hypothetical protein